MSTLRAPSEHASALIQECLQSNVLLFGDFKLKSGRQSPYFVNAGLLYTGKQLALLAEAYAHMLHSSGIQFDVIFGPAYKGISLAAITCVELQKTYGISANFAYNRKEAKDHGEGGMLVGAPLKNQRVLILDDVITAGTAIREAIAIIKNEGGTLVGIAEVLDRQEKAKGSEESAVMQIERETGVKVLPVLTLLDIIAYLEKKGGQDDQVKQMQQYRQQYGVV